MSTKQEDVNNTLKKVVAEKESEKTVKREKADGFFQHEGAFSMRRLLAFIFAFACIGCGVFALFEKADWKVVLVSFAVPLTGSLLMMFFTSWTDISATVNALKRR